MYALSKIGIYALPYIEEKSFNDISVIRQSKKEINSEYVERTGLSDINKSDVRIIDKLVDSVKE